MRHPQVVVYANEEWLPNHLIGVTADRHWLLRVARLSSAVRALLEPARPAVLLLQLDPTGEVNDTLTLLQDAYRQQPDAACVVVSEKKLPESEQAGWSSLCYDLGARFVLFPPFTRAILEELVTHLMTATISRMIGSPPALPPDEQVIDLAGGAYEEGEG